MSKETQHQWYLNNKELTKQRAAESHKRYMATEEGRIKDREARIRYRNTEKYKETFRKNYLKKMYNITPEYYDTVFLKQKGLCGICKEPLVDGSNKSIHVDHDHKTNKVRGILCQRCNHGLGLFKDNPQTLKNAIEYLDRE